MTRIIDLEYVKSPAGAIGRIAAIGVICYIAGYLMASPGNVSGGALWQALLIALAGMAVAIMAIRMGAAKQRLYKKHLQIEGELRLSQQRLQLVVEGTLDGIWDWPDTSKDDVFWSPQWKALLGYRDDELTASKTVFYELLHPDDREPCAAAVKACLEEGKPFNIEYRLRRKSGEYGWFHGKGVTSQNGGITRMTGFIGDIGERKFAESVRDRLVTQLTAANEQLEQFAYVASHDLREPLRIVVSFTDLLIKEYSGSLNEEGMQYMVIMRQAAKKMEAMVADLLEYGRLGHAAERFSRVDCNVKLQQAMEALGESIRSTEAVIRSERLPKVMANPRRFSRLLQNLLGNAIKYQRPGVPPAIEVRAKDHGDHWLFAVADNGIGIRNEHLEYIFAPFKRLHSDHEYAGTGIGLAICRRIVESLGGTIWAESVAGSGSVFYFTVPKREGV